MTDAQEALDNAALPALLVVDADPQALEVTASALRRRFGSDYRVLTATSAEAGLDVLEQLARRDEALVLVAADLHLPGMSGVELLERAHTVDPRASRILLVAMDKHHTRVPFTELATLQQATVLGRIDFWMVKGWATPEEWLYPQVQEAITAWSNAYGLRHLLYRMVGEQWEPRTHELRDLLARNGVPFAFYAVDSAEGRRLVTEFGVDLQRLPALIRNDGGVLHKPTTAEMARSHGIETQPSSRTYDLAVVGAGPAGLGAAVYGASEGLRTLVLECQAIGGQAGTSSMIRNYLGFQRGISGGELAHRAWQQAVLFGADFVFGDPINGLSARSASRVVARADGTEAVARAVIIAVGMTYRRLPIPALDRLVGLGVYYTPAGVEAPAIAGERAYVVGGANSAGQAALHLAKYADRVTLLVRSESLTAGMSDYLIRQITATSNIEVRTRTRVVDGFGQFRLEGLRLEDINTGEQEDVAAAAVFILIGAEPHTGWLRDVLELDHHGFIMTGRDVSASRWPLQRTPLPFETSVPGVFAVGDVRHGSVKRVAGAVGEGSVTVGSVHQYLAEAPPSLQTITFPT